MIIDKDRFIEYLNDHYGDRFRINDVSSSIVKLNRYHVSQIPKASRYYDEAKETDYIDINMIETIWDGWLLRDNDHNSHVPRLDYHGKYFTKVNHMTHKFNLYNYHIWLVESRNKKLEGILE